MNVLITGAGGLVGRALQRTAPNHFGVRSCRREELDVADERHIASLRARKPDIIVNAAVYLAADRAESEPALARATNTDGPRHLAQLAREIGARLVHLSTAYVFDGTSSIAYKPDAATNPLSVYGTTKRDGELAVLDILPYDSVVLRTSWLYGADGGNFVPKMLRDMREHGAVRAVHDQIGTPTSARSLAETIWKIVSDTQLCGIHHWTDAGVASWYDFAVALAEDAAFLGWVPRNVVVTPIAAEDYLTVARRPRFSVLDTESLTSRGYVPVHWRTNLRSVLGELHDV